VSQNKLQIAFSFHQQGQLDKAQELYDELLSLNGDHFDVLHLSGLVAYQKAHFEKADYFFKKAMEINFFNASLHLNRGVAFMAAQRFEEGLRSFECSILIQPDFPDAYYNLGVALQSLKHFEPALENYDYALVLKPGYVDACNNRGNVLHDLNRPSDALVSFGNAIAIEPQRADLYFNSGISLKMMGHLEDSLKKMNSALTLKQDYFAARNNCGVILNQLNFHAEALESFETAITLQPGNGDAYHHQGLVLSRMNRHTDALTAHGRAISIHPYSAELFYHQGHALQNSKKYDEALKAYEKSISLKPDFAEAFFGSGYTLHESKRLEDALKNYRRAVQIKPDYAEAFNSLGVTMQELQRPEDAFIHFDKAISIKSDFAEAYNNRGVALKEMGRFEEASKSYEKAILIKPNYSEAYYNLGLALQELKSFGFALNNYEKTTAIDPNNIEAYNNLGALFKEINCFNDARLSFLKVLELKVGKENLTEEMEQWFSDFLSIDFQPANFGSEEELKTSLSHLEGKIDRCLEHIEIVRGATGMLQPVIDQFLFNMNGFYIAYLQENVVEIMTKYSCLMSQALGLNKAKIRQRSGHTGKIRLGLASGLLKSHNGANWAYNWLANLPDDYQIFTYAFNRDSDWLTQKFSNLGTHRFLRFDKENFRRSIEIMLDDELDLLMLPDVGMTSASRILSLHRVAPVQFTAWGHPITTGSQNIDFFLSSDLMEPEDAQSHYSEQLVRIPNLGLYLTTPQPIQIAQRNFSLPEGAILFGCLQSLFKYLPQYDCIYPLITKQVPNALFVFLEGIPYYSTKILKQRLRDVFQSHGLDYERHVQFLPRVSESEYIGLLAQMDVILDTVGWTGGNTSLQALELGKPIVTLPGKFMRGRHTYAMLRMMNLDQYVATSIENFVDKAVEFGANQEARRQFEADVMSRKHLLYEDRTFIDGFDHFLKNAAKGINIRGYSDRPTSVGSVHDLSHI
jgi:predicted O-linked N-acetylglucosamine transferase (SPINDLY family)